MLQRFRDDLDEAGRAGAESRLQGLRTLAEQAVLAVELEKLLERHAAELRDPMANGALPGLAALKDRMLDHVASAGLEIVRLCGARASAVTDLAEVECWRWDGLYASPVVVEEVEAAIRVDGAPLRRGRVVIAGPHGPQSQNEARPVQVEQPAPDPGLGSTSAAPVKRPARITCPIAGCGVENQATAATCVGCLTPLAGFTRLSLPPDVLFNEGLQAARIGDSAVARECFAAILEWHPDDITTGNAHALACLDAGDVGAARSGWEHVLACSPSDSLAARGLACLEKNSAPHPT